MPNSAYSHSNRPPIDVARPDRRRGSVLILTGLVLLAGLGVLAAQMPSRGHIARSHETDGRAVSLPSAAPAPTGSPSPLGVLYEEDLSHPAGKRFAGSAHWRTEAPPPTTGSQEVGVRADIAIPEQKLEMRWLLRPNEDKALPASHVIEMMFTLPREFAHGGIANIPGVLMKSGESLRGVPLSGLAVKVTSNFFMIGLSAANADKERNLYLLREQEWIDVPIVYDDGKRAILAIEKGAPGNEAFSTAFADWHQ
jgi:hypothetical protein